MAALERRLAAIIHADVAGFTRLMEDAETRTYRHLKAAQVEVWRPAIEAGGGRLVGSAGDAMLAEFGSAVAAVSAAIGFQDGMAQLNAALPAHRRLLFRVGVHLGEIIVDADDQNIFGDGVNLAARIEAIAEPGGIAVSRAVRDLADPRIDHAFVDGGTYRFKNVSRPVRIYHVRTAPRGTLRFEGSDSTGQAFGFAVALERLRLLPEGMTIGRAADQCELVIRHATVSRRHARLMLAGGTLQVEDLGSSNGTVVAGVALRAGQPVRVECGSTLRIGDVALAVAAA
jgi:adenylate cyclase